MLPAQPPYSRRRSGTRKATFRMWIWSGRMWFLNWSRNTMMVSYAMEPQTRIDMPGMPFGRRGDYTGEEALTPGRCAAAGGRWTALTPGAGGGRMGAAIKGSARGKWLRAVENPAGARILQTGQTHRKVGTQSHRSNGPATQAPPR